MRINRHSSVLVVTAALAGTVGCKASRSGSSALRSEQNDVCPAGAIDLAEDVEGMQLTLDGYPDVVASRTEAAMTAIASSDEAPILYDQAGAMTEPAQVLALAGNEAQDDPKALREELSKVNTAMDELSKRPITKGTDLGGRTRLIMDMEFKIKRLEKRIECADERAKAEATKAAAPPQPAASVPAGNGSGSSTAIPTAAATPAGPVTTQLRQVAVRLATDASASRAAGGTSATGSAPAVLPLKPTGVTAGLYFEGDCARYVRPYVDDQGHGVTKIGVFGMDYKNWASSRDPTSLPYNFRRFCAPVKPRFMTCDGYDGNERLRCGGSVLQSPTSIPGLVYAGAPTFAENFAFYRVEGRDEYAFMQFVSGRDDYRGPHAALGCPAWFKITDTTYSFRLYIASVVGPTGTLPDTTLGPFMCHLGSCVNKIRESNCFNEPIELLSTNLLEQTFKGSNLPPTRYIRDIIPNTIPRS